MREPVLEEFENNEQETSSPSLVTAEFEMENLLPGERKMIEDVREIATPIAVKFRDALTTKYKEMAVSAYGKDFWYQMQLWIAQKGYDKGVFKILDFVMGMKLLQEQGIDTGMLEENGLKGVFLMFNFPKPVARYWSRTDPSKWIPFGKVYDGTLGTIWDELGEVDKKELFFNRVSPYGRHRWDKYYYVWFVSETELLPGDEDDENY